jgi:hypothetical protein
LFAQVAAWPPSPDALKPTPVEAAIASATTALTTAVQKHQSDYLTLLKSVVVGSSVSETKIKRLRANSITLMTSTNIRVMHAGGTCILLEHLYKIAQLEEKKAR